MAEIYIGSKYGNPNQMSKSASVVNSGSGTSGWDLNSVRNAMFDGRVINAQSVGGSGGIAGIPGGGSAMQSVPKPYLPEYASPDRIQFPKSRAEANRYWRLFYKVDPITQRGIQMWGNMMWSDFGISGPGVEGDVKKLMEDMISATKFHSILPSLTTEYLAMGEVIPHCYFDSDRGIWTYIAFHNPDQIEVLDTPFVNVEPFIEMVPDENLRRLVRSSEPGAQKFRESMPAEVLGLLMSGKRLPLDTRLNVTFLPRRLHPYDIRGTSLLSMLFRVYLYEDSVFSASIAVARRHAAPLRVAKIGDAAIPLFPTEEQEAKLAGLLMQAEQDPLSWLIYHSALQLEAFGVTDKVIPLGRELETIERMKLMGLGINKGIIHGEITYASTAGGLQVLLMQIKQLRDYFEYTWILPKFFKPIAEINEWVLPTPAEVAHRFRVKRTAQELDDMGKWIIPQIKWHRQLESKVDKDLVRAMADVESQLGVKMSPSTKYLSMGMDLEEETRNIVRDKQRIREIIQEEYPAGVADVDKVLDSKTMKLPNPLDEVSNKKLTNKKPPGGGGAGGAPAGLGAEEEQGLKEGGPLELPEPTDLTAPKEAPVVEPASKHIEAVWRKTGKLNYWTSSEVTPLIGLMQGKSLDSLRLDGTLWETLVHGDFVDKKVAVAGLNKILITFPKDNAQVWRESSDKSVVHFSREKRARHERKFDISDIVDVGLGKGKIRHGVVTQVQPIYQTQRVAIEHLWVAGDYSWDNICKFLTAEEFPVSELESLKEILQIEGVLQRDKSASEPVRKMEAQTLKEIEKITGVSVDELAKGGADPSYLVGSGNANGGVQNRANLIGDASKLLKNKG